jgi:hypothetical protein
MNYLTLFNPLRYVVAENQSQRNLPMGTFSWKVSSFQQYIKNSEAFAEQFEKNPPQVTANYPGPQGESLNLEKHNSKRKLLAREALLSELNNHETVELSSEEIEIAVEMMRSEGFKSRFEN